MTMAADWCWCWWLKWLYCVLLLLLTKLLYAVRTSSCICTCVCAWMWINIAPPLYFLICICIPITSCIMMRLWMELGVSKSYYIHSHLFLKYQNGSCHNSNNRYLRSGIIFIFQKLWTIPISITLFQTAGWGNCVGVSKTIAKWWVLLTGYNGIVTSPTSKFITEIEYMHVHITDSG